MNDSQSAELLVAGHRIARLLEAPLRDLGVSAGEAVLLTKLMGRPLTMSGIMNTLHIGGSTATSLVTRLERAGLVSRRRNPEDARSFIVDATPAGRDMGEASQSMFETLDQELDRAGPTAIAGHSALMARLSSLSPSSD